MESPLLEQLHRQLIQKEVLNSKEPNPAAPSYAGVKALSLTHKTFALWIDSNIYTRDHRFSYLGHVYNDNDFRFFFKIDMVEGNTPSPYKGAIKDSFRVLMNYGVKNKKIMVDLPLFGSHSEVKSSIVMKDILVVTMGTLHPPIERSRNFKKRGSKTDEQAVQEAIQELAEKAFEQAPAELNQLPAPIKQEEHIEDAHFEEADTNKTMMQDIIEILKTRDKLMALVAKYDEHVDMEFDKDGHLKITFSI